MLFVGDDWAEDHHDVEVQDESGRRLARARLPEGIAGLSSRLHELLAEHLSGVSSSVSCQTGPAPRRCRRGGLMTGYGWISRSAWRTRRSARGVQQGDPRFAGMSFFAV